MKLRRVEATTRANIALVKYWGKADRGRNIPAVGSLSLTLDGMETRTLVEPADQRTYLLDGKPMQPAEAERIARLADRIGIPAGQGFRFDSVNDFPTAAGLASSASGGAAAVLALVHAAGLEWTRRQWVDETLRVSGSAPRSLLGGFARLDPVVDGVRLRRLESDGIDDLRVLVARTQAGRKAVGSREAMEASLHSPYWPAWVASHPQDLNAAEAALQAGDWAALWQVMEHSTLKMHALPWTGRPAVWYWTPVTLAVLAAVREGQTAGLAGGFTMDAGPHVKLFCRTGAVTTWRARLEAVEGVLDVLEARPGAAPELVVDGQPCSWVLPAE